MSLSLATLLAAALIGTGPTSVSGERCDEQGSRDLVLRFIRAFNRGDAQELDSVFARGMSWRWYSVATAPGKRIQRAAYDRSTLVRYFRTRHKKNERLALRSFRYVGWMNGYGHFEYELMRRADDMRPRVARVYVGKGAVSCFAGKLAVWSMGADT